jgi:hypothetical protein
MIKITVEFQNENICKIYIIFHYYLTWFLSFFSIFKYENHGSMNTVSFFQQHSLHLNLVVFSSTLQDQI